MQGRKRLQKEIAQLLRSPPDGVVCYPVGESLCELEAKLHPMDNTPYSQGVFKLAISCGDHYPNEPPNVRFVTPVYHPNIDSEGRICLNLLKMPPKGCWAPSFNIAAVLSGIQILLAQPNPDDPLMTDVTDEYRTDLSRFIRKATEWTLKYAAADTFRAAATAGEEKAGIVEADVEPKELSPRKRDTPKKAAAKEQQQQHPSNDNVTQIRRHIQVKKIKLF